MGKTWETRSLNRFEAGWFGMVWGDFFVNSALQKRTDAIFWAMRPHISSVWIHIGWAEVRTSAPGAEVDEPAVGFNIRFRNQILTSAAERSWLPSTVARCSGFCYPGLPGIMILLYRLYRIPIKPAEQTHEGCFLGEDLDSNLCGGWFYQTMVLPDHFEEHVPMTIDFNWDSLNDWSIQRRAHSRRFKKMFSICFVSPHKRTHLVSWLPQRWRVVQVGVLPRDPSHGQQRGGADRGGAAVSGARRHLSSPGAATRSGRWLSWLPNGWVYGTCMGHLVWMKSRFLWEVVQYGYGDSSTDSSVDDLI